MQTVLGDAGHDAHPGPINAAAALDYALRYIGEENERLIERYLTWRNE